jgi:hypothetical protein
MSQTGYTPILIYASGTTGNTPSASNLTSNSTGAELAINYYDGKLFYKDNSGAVQTMATSGIGNNLTYSSTNTTFLFNSTGSVQLPVGTTAQRPATPATAMFRYNSTLNQFEGYNGSIWGGIGGAQAGGAIQINNTTASVSYTVATGTNGFSVGPITTASGVSITVASGQRWVII